MAGAGRGQYQPDDQDCTKRILANLGAEELVHEGNVGSALVLCPLVQVVANKDYVIQAPANLCQVRLEGTLAQVALACFGNGVGIVFDSVQDS